MKAWGHIQSGRVFCLAHMNLKSFNELSRFKNELAFRIKKCVFPLLWKIG